MQAYQKIPGRIPADIEVSAEEGKHVLLRAAAPLWRGKNGKSGIAVVEIKSDTRSRTRAEKGAEGNGCAASDGKDGRNTVFSESM